MTFDYFNSSHLAFGSKLTKAFNQLDKLYKEAENNLSDLFRIYEIYSQYINRNYRAPFPLRSDAPCRSDEIFDVINDSNVLKKAYINDSGKFHVEVNIFKRISNRFTIASGTTSKKKGYAFVVPSVSNVNPNSTIKFVSSYDEGEGNFLFQYRIGSDNSIYLIGNDVEYLIPGDTNYLTGMSLGDTLLTDVTTSKTYKATDCEAVLCIGYSAWGDDGQHNDGSPLSKKSCLDVRINSKQVAFITGWQCKHYIVVYLKPGDVLSGRFKKAVKVNYTKGSSPSPEPPETMTFTGSISNLTSITSGTIDGYLNHGENISLAGLGQGPKLNIRCSDWSALKNISIKMQSSYQYQSVRSYSSDSPYAISIWYCSSRGTTIDIEQFVAAATAAGKTIDRIEVDNTQSQATYTNFTYTLKEE